VDVSFSPTGHLLGAAAITMVLEDGRKIVFGGDLGRYDRPVLRDPDSVRAADVLLVESTYGDRTHEADDHGAHFGELVRETVARHGKVVIPAFAIGRVEEILYWLKHLEESHQIPVVPVFVDSPMAVEALGYYGRRVSELDDDMREAGKSLASFATRRFQTVSSAQQSMELVASKTPAVIISASGMATGGRVLHHLKRVLPDARNTVLFAGYQAAGTRGRALVEGAREVKIHGQFVPVSANVERLDSMSAHADCAEILRWLRGFSSPPSMTYIVHGEPPAMQALQREIGHELGPAWKTRAPEYLETVEI
jgi:metallo-beta-lactamase family protein